MTEFDNIKTSVIPYNQQEIEHVMRQAMYHNGITDVLYEGSNVSQLTSIISYVISSLNVNTAINLQETLLPLATKRMNILFGARQLGYEPHAVKSYKYKLLLKPLYDQTKTITLPDGTEIIDTNDQTDRTISIIKNTRFKCGDATYYYVGPTLDNIITVSNYDIQYINDSTRGRAAKDITIEIPVVEGVMTTYLEDEMLQMTATEYTENNETKTKQDYLIGYRDVEEDFGLQVYLTYIDDDGFQVIDEEWTKSEQFLIDETLDYNKNKFVRKENIILGYPAIFFQFAGLGKGIRTGTLIKVNVLQSLGPDGEAIGKFEVHQDDVEFTQEMEVLEYSLLEKGRTYETDSEIKDNAVVFKNTGNRAVTKYDYITITKRNPLVQECDAWGGEDESPKEKGNIWVSCTPSEQQRPIIEYPKGYEIDIGTPSKYTSNPVQRNWNNWYINDINYSKIIRYLDNFKIMTMDINYRHPLYINFYYFIDVVKYDLSKSISTTNSIIFQNINKFFVEHLENFQSEYFNSNIQRILDTALDYNSGVNINLNITGTLCVDMIDKFNLLTYGRKVIKTDLSWPYENVYDEETGDLKWDMFPKIDGDFGYYNGKIHVNFQNPIKKNYTKTVFDILYSRSVDLDVFYENEKIGEYIVDGEKETIELVWDFDLISEDEIFGPDIEEVDENLDDNLVVSGTYKSYTEFNINYYPFDENLVNINFSKNRIPRLKKVEFSTI